MPFFLALPPLAPALRAPERGDFSSALRDLAAKPDSPARWQLTGLFEVARGHYEEAERAFGQALVAKATEPVELEPDLRKSLLRALDVVEGVFSPDSSRSAILSNRGLLRISRGDLDAGFRDIDEAAVLTPDWGGPWVNGAVGWLRKGQIAKAAEAAKHGRALREGSAAALAVFADVNLAAAQIEGAAEDLDRALATRADHPVALRLRAELQRRTGHARESERAMARALLGGPVVAARSQLQGREGVTDGLLGRTSDLHLSLDGHGLTGARFGYRIAGYVDSLGIEARDDARQIRGIAEVQAVGRFGGLAIDYRVGGGDRPGAVTSSLGLDPSPAARFDFSQTRLLYVNRGGKLSLSGAYRGSKVHAWQGNAGYSDLKDDHWLAELRYDDRVRGTGLTVGASAAFLDRRHRGASVVEPTEQLLGDGRQTLSTAYALASREIGGGFDLSLGVIAADSGRRIAVEPLFELGARGLNGKPIRLGVRARLNEAVGNLLPENFLAGKAQENPIDRTLDTPSDFNRSPTLFQEEGRQLSMDLTFVTADTGRSRWQTTLYRHGLQEFYELGGDPQVSTSLLLTPFGDGTITGIAERFRLEISSRSSLRGCFRLQTSSGDPETPTFDARAYPGRVPVRLGRLPNVPSFQAEAAADFRFGPTLASLVAGFVGPRDHAVTIEGPLGRETFIDEAPSALGLHLFLFHRVGSLGAVSVRVFNLTQANFYPGYPGGTTVEVGFALRF